MKGVRHTVALLAAAGLLIAAPASAGAQGFTLDGHGGVTIPTGDLSSFEQPGASLGIRGGYHLNPRFEVRANIGAELFQEGVNQTTGAPVPDFQLYSFTGGVDYAVTPPEESRWDVSVNAAVGLTNVNTDTIRTGTELSEFSSTYPSAGAGVTFGYDVSEEAVPHAEFFVSAEGRFVFSDEEETSRFDPFSDDLSGGMGTITTWPVEVGISLKF